MRPLVKATRLGQVTAVAAGGISTDARERAGVRADGGAPVVISSSGKTGRRRTDRVSDTRALIASHLRDGLFYVTVLTMILFFFFLENLYFDTMPTSLGASPFVRKTYRKATLN